MSDKVGAVMVVGGGIAGMQASLDLADSGFKVYVVDSSPSIGGTMARLDKTFPTNDCAMCIMSPKLVATGRHHNIELVTNARIDKVEGEEGDFNVTVVKLARRIDETKCTGCGVCQEECPIEAIDEFNADLTERAAAYVPYPQSVPLVYKIDKEKCIGCGICEHRCKAGAVIYDQKDEELQLNVGSIIMVPGFENFDPKKLTQFGYGRYPNVVSAIEFERMLSASGPYAGLVLRPSDGVIPARVAFLQCIGSRDEKAHTYCSGVCCMYAMKEAVIAQEHVPGLSAHIYFMDIRAFGKEFDDYYRRAQGEWGIGFTRSRVAAVDEDPETDNLKVRYVENGEVKEAEYDMVVLSTALEPPKDAEHLSKVFGIELNEHGFAKTDALNPLNTTRPGVYVAGAFSSPKDIPDSVAQASGAAAKAAGGIAEARGTMVTKKEYPPERKVEYQKPRIGVFVCHCGINIGGVVRVPEVVEYASTLPYVVHSEHNLYTCSQDTQERITETIAEKGLNRVVVASCTPRTHEPLFQSTTMEGGLNRYLFEMTNIRDQCSWVHMHLPDEATEKSKDLVRMAVAKAALCTPLERSTMDIHKRALVVGGGVAGMNAALEIGRQGYEVFLVEKSRELGGSLRRVRFTLKGENPNEYLDKLEGELQALDNVNIFREAEVQNIDGYVGNFKTKLMYQGEVVELEHGVVVIATGGKEYVPKEYLYGKNEKVVTQLELEHLMAAGRANVKEVVMIQCVGSRNDEFPFCSRICCTTAMKNALKLKEKNPDVSITILYRDIRTYGLKEEFYREAAEKGVRFVRYDDDFLPEVNADGGPLKVTFKDPVLDEDIQVCPDLLVLSAAIHPLPDNEELAQMLKVPLSKDGFFLEAHMKLRPVDFATDGVYLCGTAHSPKFVDETISQACATAARAVTVLSKEHLEGEGTISIVDRDKCSGCETCIELCPYNAIEKQDGKAHVIEVLCKGCGACAGGCRNGAIQQKGFRDEQLFAMIESAMEGG